VHVKHTFFFEKEEVFYHFLLLVCIWGPCHFFFFVYFELKVNYFLKASPRKKDKRKPKHGDKHFKVSMTINVGFFNIPKKMLGTMEKFVEYKYAP
jgi:hypothetical protein